MMQQQCTTPENHEPGATPERQPAPNPRAWLEHIPAQRRSTVANWFHFAVRNGASTPAEVCHRVSQTVQEHQQARGAWTVDPDSQHFLHHVMEHLYGDPAGALTYAHSVIAYEALPYEQRQRVKARRTLRVLTQGQPATAKQLAYLTILGYQGAPPANQAEASQLIDQLKQKGGR